MEANCKTCPMPMLLSQVAFQNANLISFLVPFPKQKSILTLTPASIGSELHAGHMQDRVPRHTSNLPSSCNTACPRHAPEQPYKPPALFLQGLAYLILDLDFLPYHFFFLTWNIPPLSLSSNITSYLNPFARNHSEGSADSSFEAKCYA